jgi:hypothetical protein
MKSTESGAGEITTPFGRGSEAFGADTEPRPLDFGDGDEQTYMT